MTMDYIKKLFLLLFGVLLICTIVMTGCKRSNLFVPEYTYLEPAPIMLTADQLYKEYEVDEASAEAIYQGKHVWIIEARVGDYVDSESGNYLLIKDFLADRHPADGPVVVLTFTVSTLQLEHQYSDDFSDIGDGYFVEVIGECQGISDGVIIIEIDRIVKTKTISTMIGAAY